MSRVHNFKAIAVVPTSVDLLDIVLSRTQRKTPTVVRKGWKISRIRSFYVRKVKYTAQSFREKLDTILEEFPNLDELHPFLSDLINVLYSRDHYKLALGQVNSCRTTIANLAQDYSHLLKFGDSLYRCKALKRAAMGRMATATKKLKASLGYLEQVRQHLSRLPAIDPSARTLILTGYPNVGKSSFINKVSRANVDVQPYAFTTKSLFVGHFFDRDIRYQALDTPGLLDHPLEQMNTIEMQAITALAHLQSCVLYFIDISEECGYTIQQQVALFHNIKPLFQNKPMLVVANKVDLRRLDQLEPEDRAAVESVAADRNTELIEMSNVSEMGIHEVKTKACRILLEYRVARKLQTHRVDDVMNRLHVARPEPRDQRARPANIPASVLAARAARAAAGGGAPASTVRVRGRDRAAALAAALAAGGGGMAVDEAGGVPVKRTEKDVELEQGGPGIYQPDLRKHFQLKEEDWRYDVVPEIMDGKNVADFFADDIAERLDALEREEAELERLAAAEEEEELDEELAGVDMELAKRIRSKKTLIKKAADLRKSNNKPVLPRKARKRNIDDVEEHLAGLGVDAKRVRGRSRRRAASVLAARMEPGVDGSFADEGVDPEARARSKSMGRNASVNPGTGYRHAREHAGAARLGRRDQKQMNQLSRAGESDRRIPDLKPKHLFSGKRGIGKTDRR